MLMSTAALCMPADPEATPEAQALFQRLQKIQKKGTMYGHQDDLMYGHTWWNEPGCSDTWASYPDTQDYGSKDFAGVSGGWLPTEDTHELQMRHNNTSKVHIQRFLAEVESGQYPEPDVFVFAMGTNDSNLGTAEEALKGKALDSVDVTTMAGGARWSIQTIIERFPRCRVFVCTPIQTANEDHNAFNRKKIEILRDICRSLSIQLIDCYGESGITEKLEDGHGNRYLRDGLHPAEEGQQLMGRYIAKEIRNNYY